ESCALAYRLCGEERIEDAPKVIHRDAGSVVFHQDLNQAVLRAGSNRQSAFAIRFEHGLLGIHDEVQEDLLELMSVAKRPRKVGRKLGDELDVADLQFVCAQI